MYAFFARLRSNTVRIFFNRKRGVPIDDWRHVYRVPAVSSWIRTLSQ